jgi:hypothetical protein
MVAGRWASMGGGRKRAGALGRPAIITNTKKNRSDKNSARKLSYLNRQAAAEAGSNPSRGTTVQVKVSSTYNKTTNETIVAVGRLIESGQLSPTTMNSMDRGSCGYAKGSFLAMYNVPASTMRRYA